MMYRPRNKNCLSCGSQSPKIPTDVKRVGDDAYVVECSRCNSFLAIVIHAPPGTIDVDAGVWSLCRNDVQQIRFPSGVECQPIRVYWSDSSFDVEIHGAFARRSEPDIFYEFIDSLHEQHGELPW